MNLYPEEMAEISRVIKALESFMADATGPFSDIETTLSESVGITITSRNNGKVIGYVDYTDDGAIGFMTESEAPTA